LGRGGEAGGCGGRVGPVDRRLGVVGLARAQRRGLPAGHQLQDDGGTVVGQLIAANAARPAPVATLTAIEAAILREIDGVLGAVGCPVPTS
jgi:hypothetical protein